MSIGLVVDAADTAVRPVKRKQRRIRRARLDKRTTLVRRALELRQLFASELMKVGADVETPLAKLRLDEAAFALSVAQHAREKHIRTNGQGDLDDLVRAQRYADSLIKRLGLPDKPVARKVDGQDEVAAYLASRASMKAMAP